MQLTMFTRGDLMRVFAVAVSVCLLSAFNSASVKADLVLGQTVGIDFGATASADSATTWNDLSAMTTVGTGTALTSPEVLTIGDLLDTTNVGSGVSFSLTNETGFNVFDFATGTNGDGGLINHASVFSDGILSNDRTSIGRNTTRFQDFFTLTFSGLNDSLTYNFVGGFARNNNPNFNGTWVADGVVTGGVLSNSDGIQFVTDAQNTDVSGDFILEDDFASFDGLTTDGSGNLTLHLTGEGGANQVILAAVTLTAVPEPSTLPWLCLGAIWLVSNRRR